MSEIFKIENIITDCKSCHYLDVIRRCGELLVAEGYVTHRYIDGMLARDRSFSTAIGNMIAIPHGENEYKREILKTGLVILTYPDGITWGDQTVKLVIGIAAKGNTHLSILERIADMFGDEEAVEQFVSNTGPDDIYRIFAFQEITS